MKQRKLLKSDGGFTIIEVVIVLAIAASILLIVFLAVPALQRNSRNNARNNDAARFAAAVTECLANRNGQVASCDTDPEIEQGTMNQLTGFSLTETYVANGVGLVYNARCNAAGDDSTAGGGASAREFTVTYQLEPAINRCISGS